MSIVECCLLLQKISQIIFDIVDMSKRYFGYDNQINIVNDQHICQVHLYQRMVDLGAFTFTYLNYEIKVIKSYFTWAILIRHPCISECVFSQKNIFSSSVVWLGQG